MERAVCVPGLASIATKSKSTSFQGLLLDSRAVDGVVKPRCTGKGRMIVVISASSAPAAKSKPV
jgi:hypothetical protein